MEVFVNPQFSKNDLGWSLFLLLLLTT